MTKPVLGIVADPFTAQYAHRLDRLPYRAVVFCGFDGQQTPVYWAAGHDATRRNGINALKAALKLHGGECFYCAAHDDLELDHVVPISRAGTNALDNLLVACRTCNQKKAERDIDTFNVEAAGRWHSAALDRARNRIAALSPTQSLRP